MASANFTRLTHSLATGAINYGSDTFKAMLVTSIPSESNLDTWEDRADVTVEHAATGGYTAGGFNATAHGIPPKVTEFLTNLSDPWDCVSWGDALIVSERMSHRICEYDSTTGALRRVIVQGAPLARVDSNRFVVRIGTLTQIRAEFAQREQEAFMRVQEQIAGLKQDYAEQVMKAQNEIAMLKQALANKEELARAEIEKAMIAAQSQERQAEIRRESEISREQIRTQSQEQIAQMEARVSMMLKQMEDHIGAVQTEFTQARERQQVETASRPADAQPAQPAEPMVLNIQVDAKPAGGPRSIEFERDANGKVVGARVNEQPQQE